MTKELSNRCLQREQLNNTLYSYRSELIVIYGRRRIGKTFLIRTFYTKHIIFSFSGLRNGTLSSQLENFMLILRSVSNSFNTNTPKNWLEAFTLFKQHLKGVRKTKKRKLFSLMSFLG